jgi:hypothetical protein
VVKVNFIGHDVSLSTYAIIRLPGLVATIAFKKIRRRKQ